MKQMLVVLFVVSVVQASAQSNPVKLTVCLTEEALDGMVIEEDGSATLDNEKASSLVELNQNSELIAMYPMSYKAGSPFRKFFTLFFDERADLESLKESYEANEFVQWALPVPDETPELLGPYYPNDAKFANDQMWYVHQGTDKADVNGPEAWEWTLGDTSVVIAICGGGIKCLTEPNNQYFSADVASNLWTNWGEIPNNGIDDDNNGFIDDIHGWNFNCNDPDIENSCLLPGDPLWWHGTPMASHAASAIDSCVSTNCGVGVAPKCRIMGLPSSHWNSLAYAVDNGARVFVYAFAFNPTFWQPFIDTAFAHGVLFVNAAGNNVPGPIYQSGYGVSVANVDSNNYVGTTTGSGVKLSAPALYGGSSYAAPVAGGVAALMRSFNPHISIESLRRIFISPLSCNPISQSGTGAGRIDAYKALKNVVATVTLDSILNDGGYPLLTWTANTFLDSSGVFNLGSLNYIVQRKWMYDTAYADIATLSSSASSYKDEEILISYFSDIFSYRIVTKIAYGGSVLFSVPSNKKEIRGEFLKLSSRTDEKSLPTETKLLGNFPNPFNPVTKISFDIGKASHVTLRIFDVLGKEVSTIMDEFLEVGSYVKEVNASTLSTGVYFYTMRAGSYFKAMKLIVAK